MKPVNKPSLAESFKSFHEDEDGMETLQAVMIAGVAAIILIVLIAFWKDIKGWVKGKLNKAKSDGDAAETPE